MTVVAARDDQVRENRLRRIAERQGRTLIKSRLRDPNAEGYGTYTVSGTYYGAHGTGLTLDEVESHLVGEAAGKAKAEYDELNELVHRVSGDIDVHKLGTMGSVSVLTTSIDDADYFMQEYQDATAEQDLPLDYEVELLFDNKQHLIAWLRTLPEPKGSA